MKWISGSKLVGVLAGTLGVLFLVPCAPVRSQNSNKRCYSVDEPYYKIHDLKVTTEIDPIKHCYSDKDHPYRYSIVDVPVSLAVGTVRTPEFSPRKTSWHWISRSGRGAASSPTNEVHDGGHSMVHPPLEGLSTSDTRFFAQKTRLYGSDGQIAASGSSTNQADAKFTKDNIFKFLGKFPAL